MLSSQKMMSAPSGGATYVDDVFSTYLYTGTATTTAAAQSINNGIDLATEGGLVWVKQRNGTGSNWFVDTARGASNAIRSNGTNTTFSYSPYSVSAFNSNGFTVNDIDSGGTNYGVNLSPNTYASWTFRKQPKFFDVVTYTGNGAVRTIAHNLGSTPGCIIIKAIDSGVLNWQVYHRSLGNTQSIRLNTTAAAGTYSTYWNNTSPTSTEFTLGTGSDVNYDGITYVAYLFAHDAGGFGAAGTDNVISCGSFTTDSGGNASVNLGYEPQWVMYKAASTTSFWVVTDTMRGWYAPSTACQRLFPNTTNEEVTTDISYINSTGMTFGGSATLSPNATYIYIAIRRPMKPPTTGTEVFKPVARAGTGTNNLKVEVGFAPDLIFPEYRNADATRDLYDRLRGPCNTLVATSTDAEAGTANYPSYGALKFENTSYTQGNSDSAVYNASGINFVDWVFRRAPGFFDQVCYTGNGSARTVTHNLGAAPQLMIIKIRDAATNWMCYSSSLGNDKYLNLNNNSSVATSSVVWNNTAPTSSVFSLGNFTAVNEPDYKYVAYLFGTVAGVSKVGSYTGTGTTNSINCGFSGGARFVMIKRTDSTGDWYVWDTARGIVSGNDPYLLMNSTAAETTSTDYIDPYSAGFEISSTAPSAINASGGTFIYLAIA